MQSAFEASFPADHPVEAAKVPAWPTQHILPKAVPVALSLIQLPSTFTQATVLKAQAPGRKDETLSLRSFRQSRASKLLAQ